MSYQTRLKALGRAILSSANIPGVIAFVFVSAFAIHADRQNGILHHQAQRAEVQASVGLIRARLEGNINANIQLVRGLVAVMATEPDMTQQRFSALAANLFGDDYHLRTIAAAPDFVIRLMHPLDGNAKAIGLNLLREPELRDSALRARDTRQLVLAGPVDLVAGGRGFIGRLPVFLDAERPGETFWGLVAAVIDADKLYSDSGLLDPDLGLDVAIAGRDAVADDPSAFFGEQFVFGADPVTARVILPTGGWTIAATPSGGWKTTPDNTGFTRLAMFMMALAVSAPFLVAGRLGAERRRNLARLQRREAELERLSRRLELAVDASRIGVWEMDFASGAIVWDERIHAIYGRADDGLPKVMADWDAAMHPDDSARARQEFLDAIEARGPYQSEFRIVRPDGGVVHLRARGAFFAGPDGGDRMVGAEWDVTADVALTVELSRAKTLAEQRSEELEAANRRIEHNALHDPLTGLPNRRYLDEVLAMVRAGEAAGVGLLHVDLDRFKQINDTLGHAAGDAMLIHAAGVLRANAGAGDFVARIGGDEFVVVCTLAFDDADLSARAERMVRAMRQPVPYLGHECRFGVSIGIAAERGAGFDAKRLMVNADIALYRAKSRGRNRHEFFTRALQAEIVRTKRTADEILNGLERDEFQAWFQPQFDAKTFEIAGVEALARWNHPQHGMLAPDAFLKIAEELNVVAAIDRTILDQTLAEFAGWRRAGAGVGRVSVNVSAHRLAEDDLIASLGLLDIPADALSFELVESIFLDDNDALIDWNIDRIKDLGIDIEIDDFGTGYASIVSLMKLKPKRLKIDRQLVMPIVETPGQRKVVASIIEIGKSLGIGVVAEGVETMEHAAILRDLGCDTLQGFAFGRAMSPAAFREFLKARGLRKAG